MRSCLLIDDVPSALEGMTPAGRCAVTKSTYEARAEVLAFCERRRWPVVSYRKYVEWAQTRLELCSQADYTMMLDPLFPGDRSRWLSLRLHRSWTVRSNHFRARFVGWPPKCSVRGRPIVLVDDAAYSGTTLETAVRALIRRGASIRAIHVGVARPQAIARLRGLPVEAFFLVPPEYDILHGRDFLAWLPFSGRRIAGRRPVTAKSRRLFVRLAPAHFGDGRWLKLEDAPELRASLGRYATDVVQHLQHLLLRTPTVADLVVLGDGVGVSVKTPECRPQASTRLDKLLK